MGIKKYIALFVVIFLILGSFNLLFSSATQTASLNGSNLEDEGTTTGSTPSDRADEKDPEDLKSASSSLQDEYPFPENYPAVEELYDWYDELEATYPDLVDQHTYGESYEERDLRVLEITSDNDTQVEEKPAVLIDGTIHAREWSSTQVASYYMWRILNEYDSNETINWMVNNRRIFVAPMTNPDGYIHDGDGDYPGDWWRKNRNDSTPNPGKISIGVDLNRNWDISWEDGSDDPSSDTYRGESPFSEPETQHLKEFILENEIDSYQNLHSYADCLLIPYMHTTDPSPHDDWYRGMADNMTSLTSKYGDEDDHYSYGQPHEEIGYSAPGGAADWVYEETGAHGLVFEIYTGGYAFYPPEEDIITINKDLDDSLIYQTRIADTDLGDGNETLQPPVPHLVYGVVEDEDEEPIDGVEVKIENDETGESLSIDTNDEGYYEFNFGNLVDEGYDIGDEFTVKVNSNPQTNFTVDDSWGRRVDIEYTDGLEPYQEEVPTWEIGNSWTYSQNIWYNDTESDDYLELEEKLTYTLDEIGYYTYNETTHYGYNLSLSGEVLDGEGEVYIEDIDETVGFEIDEGYSSGYQFLRMSDLAVVVDDQFRNIEGTTDLPLNPDFESWTKINNHYEPAVEEYDFPMNTTGDKFWANTTVNSTGYNAYKIFGVVGENETIEESYQMNSTTVTPYTEEVEVPAGKFESVYVNSTQSDEGSYRDRWYDDEVGSFVKEDLESPEVDWIRELESYEVEENQNNLSIEPSEAWIEESVFISGEFPDNPGEDLIIKLHEDTKPVNEWNVTTDEDGKFEKTIQVPVAEDMTETNIEFSSIGFVAKLEKEDETEHAVSSLVIHHDNRPVYPDPPDESENVSSEPELEVLLAHDKNEVLNVTFHDAADDSIIGSDEKVESGDHADTTWEGLEGGKTYEWYANATLIGEENSWQSEVWKFSTVAEHELKVDIADEDEGEVFIDDDWFEPEQLPKTFTYDHGENAYLNADPEDGWFFKEWYDEKEDEIYSEVADISLEIVKDMELTAHFGMEATFEVTDLEVDPDEVYIDEDFTIETDVYNHGDETDDHTVEFMKDDDKIGEDTVTVEPGESETASMEHSIDEAGTYEISVYDPYDEEYLTHDVTVYDLPEVETNEATDITVDSAVLHGEVTEIGMEDEVEAFFRYRKEGKDEWIETDGQSVSEEEFDQLIDGLVDNTIYEFKAVIEWNDEEDVGEVLDFTTLQEATFEITDLTVEPDEVYIEEDFSVEADVYNHGDETDDHTVEFMKDDDKIGEDTVTVEPGESETASMEHSIDEAGTYEISVYDPYDDEYLTHDVTVYSLPSVETNEAADITVDSAVLHGEVTEIGMEDEVEAFFRYRKEGKDEWIETDGQSVSEEEFDQLIDGLEDNTIYEFKAVIEWNDEEDVGEVLDFTTLKEAIFEVTDLEVDPDEVYIDEDFTIEADVYNHGDETGDYTVEFMKDDDKIGEDTVTVEPDETETASMEHSIDEAGIYEISVYDPYDDEYLTQDITIHNLPDVETNEATDITVDSAVLHGEVAEIGMEDEVEALFRYREEDEDDWIETDGQTVSEERFDELIDGLEDYTTYEFKAVIESDTSEVSGEVRSFETATEEYELTIDISSDSEGEVMVNEDWYTEEELPQTFIFEKGEQVDLDVDTTDEWIFDEWYDTSEEETYSDQPDITIEMEEDLELLAIFDEHVEEYGLIIEEPLGEGQIYVDGSEIDEYPYQEEYVEGETVELKADPGGGFEFDVWTGDTEYIDEPDSSETHIQISDDNTISARFIEEKDPADFSIEIIEYEEKIMVNEETVVGYEVINQGEQYAVQDIVFEVNGVEITREGDIGLEAGEDFTGEFEWTSDESGLSSLTVTTEDDEESIDVKVVGEGSLEIEMIEYDEELTVGSEGSLTYKVQNNESFSLSQEIHINIYDEQDELVLDEIENISLEAYGEAEREITYELEQEGTFQLLIESPESEEILSTLDIITITVEEEEGIPGITVVSLIIAILFAVIMLWRKRR